MIDLNTILVKLLKIMLYFSFVLIIPFLIWIGYIIGYRKAISDCSVIPERIIHNDKNNPKRNKGVVGIK